MKIDKKVVVETRVTARHRVLLDRPTIIKLLSEMTGTEIVPDSSIEVTLLRSDDDGEHGNDMTMCRHVDPGAKKHKGFEPQGLAFEWETSSLKTETIEVPKKKGDS
jgi:hypothetical protein